MKYEYQTIEKPVENILIKEKGSKFIGFLYPILNEIQLKYALQKIQELHPKATHICYAYRMGLNGENYRINDDGEPSGSAGLPIYNQLLANDITNVLLVSVRYFGGAKLGISNLVKTYKESAKSTIEKTKIITKELESEIKIDFNFAQQNTIFSLLNKFNAQVSEFYIQEYCTIRASVKTSQKENISEILSEMHLIFFKFI